MTLASDRIHQLPAYAVGAIAERKRELLEAGVDLIDLGAGDMPVAPPEAAVLELREALADPKMSRYGFQQGLVEFRLAVSRYMMRRFGVDADPFRHVLALLGSKEGLAHLPFGVLNPGDVCVVPEPGYPAYRGGAILSGADAEIVGLRPENGFLVDLDAIPAERLDRTKLVYLNYPNNPTGAIAPPDYLARTVEICRERGIVLAYDNPYVEITFDGYEAPSILQIPGAWDVAVEFHSFSKSFGMTGWRLGWAVGNPEVVSALSKVKSYVDTGPFLAIQHAGAAVLDRSEGIVGPIRDMFRQRRDALIEALAGIQCECETPRAGMYLWLPLPEGLTSAEFASSLLEDEGVVVLAGAVFGAAGEGFVRFSLIDDPDRLRLAAERFGQALRRRGFAGTVV